MAAIGWTAAVAPNSESSPALSASLAGGVPVDLRDTVIGLDDGCTLVTAIWHTAGNRREQQIPIQLQ
jgi:hypothetical protein